eukprot:scaffold17955_cov60-Phaeocystis_antarctica.AAC.3
MPSAHTIPVPRRRGGGEAACAARVDCRVAPQPNLAITATTPHRLTPGALRGESQGALGTETMGPNPPGPIVIVTGLCGTRQRVGCAGSWQHLEAAADNDARGRA